jgi:kynurenine formamidase
VIWHDLAHDYHAAMTTQPMIGPPCIENVWTIGERPFNIQRLVLGTHLGTHVDAPLHFIKGGRTIDTYDLGELVPFQLFAPRKAPCTSFVDRFSINKLERH